MLFFFLAGGGSVAHRALHAKYPRRPRRGALWGGPFGRHAPGAARVLRARRLRLTPRAVGQGKRTEAGEPAGGRARLPSMKGKMRFRFGMVRGRLPLRACVATGTGESLWKRIF